MDDNSVLAAGYLNRKYALSFTEFGTPTHLPNAQGWLLRRAIPDTPSLHDAMGCYPLFCCQNWNQLSHDVNQLEDDLVSLVLVTDPLANVDQASLQACFDHVHAYKKHYVVETGRPVAEWVNKSHQRNAARALRKVEVEVCPQPEEYLDEWIRLFDVLAHRHAISGMRRFSRKAFESQLSVPGMVMFRASVGSHTVGLDLWYVQGDVAQGHLTAFDEVGYRHAASYATKWRLLEYFSNRVRWINLGAGASLDASDGLSYFKQGFSTGTKTAWLCGRVFQQHVYAKLASRHAAVNKGSPGYFPAYRAGEFV